MQEWEGWRGTRMAFVAARASTGGQEERPAGGVDSDAGGLLRIRSWRRIAGDQQRYNRYLQGRSADLEHGPNGLNVHPHIVMNEDI